MCMVSGILLLEIVYNYKTDYQLCLYCMYTGKNALAKDMILFEMTTKVNSDYLMQPYINTTGDNTIETVSTVNLS